MTGPFRRARAALPVALVAAAVAIPACGGGDEGETLATFAPADAVLYAEAAVRPEGDTAESLQSILARFPRGAEAGARIAAALDTSLRDNEDLDLTFKDDIEPWLGERAGVFVTSVGRPGSETEAALVVESTDNGRAEKTIDKVLADSNPETKKQGDVEYTAGRSDGQSKAAAVVDDRVVIGSEPGVKSAIAAARGTGLADSKPFADEVGDEQAGGLAFAYVDFDKLVTQLERQPEGKQLRSLLDSSGVDPKVPYVATVGVTDDQVTIDQTQALAGGLGAGAAAALLEDLPEDAAFAAATADVAANAQRALDGLSKVGGNSSGRENPSELLDQAEEALGFEIGPTLEGLADLGVFVRGSGLLDAAGGIVATVTDRDAVAKAIDRLPERIDSENLRTGDLPDLPGEPEGFAVSPRGLPVQIIVALTEEKLVVALGTDAARRALDPQPKQSLGDSDRLGDARTSLADGYDPVALLDFDRIVSLFKGLGAGNDPRFAQIEEYLKPLGALTLGTKSEDDRQRSRLVLTFDEKN